MQDRQNARLMNMKADRMAAARGYAHVPIRA